MYNDGVMVASKTLGGKSKSNTGPLYIGRDPWYQGLVGAGFDNIQIHNRALTLAEIKQTAAGKILFNINLVLAVNFATGVVNGTVKDLSQYKNNVTVVGKVAMLKGGSPSTKTPVYGKTDYYMSVDGVKDYLVIPNTPDLALGKNNSNFTPSTDM